MIKEQLYLTLEVIDNQLVVSGNGFITNLTMAILLEVMKIQEATNDKLRKQNYENNTNEKSDVTTGNGND